MKTFTDKTFETLETLKTFSDFGNFGNFYQNYQKTICTIAMIIIMSGVALNIMAIDLQLITPSYHLAPHIILEWVDSTIEC